MIGEYWRDFIKDTLKRIAITAILIGLCITVSMLPFENKDLALVLSFVVGFIVGCPIGLLWSDWWDTWF